MVGLVLVSHSAELAGALKKLALQMSPGSAPIAVAGGIEDSEQTIGTDAISIQKAIEAVYSEDGVLVLMDLGSAMLSAETALELLPSTMKDKIRLCPAPLVEAAVVAAIHAQAGADLERVEAEARNALAAKEAHLHRSPLDARPSTHTGSPTDAKPTADAREVALDSFETGRSDIRVRIANRLGIHARPAARLVTLLSRFDAEVYVRNATLKSEWVNARSINQIALLDAQKGHELALSARGPHSEQALTALIDLIRSGFGEQEDSIEESLSGAAPAAIGQIHGQPAASGFAHGPSAIYRVQIPMLPSRQCTDPREEWRRLEGSMNLVRRNLIALQKQLELRSSGSETEIFAAHLLYLDDPILIEEARRSIEEKKNCAESAWQQAVGAIINRYRDLSDPYLRQRAVDLADIRDQVLRMLLGLAETPLSLEQSSILIAVELSPADILRLDPERILGLCSALGGIDSHSAILAKALGIPAVVGLGTEILEFGGRELALDGSSGEVWIDPSEEVKQAIAEKRAVWLKTRTEERRSGHGAASTQDRRLMQVEANIIGVNDARIALECGADGIGVMRTEFLYLQRSSPPDEEEQVQVYAQIADKMGQRPFTIRTLDIGGDKYLPYLPLRTADNPSLGQRGVRVYSDYPDLLKTQLRSILRASPDHTLSVMIPMVSTCDEIRFVKKVLEKARKELLSEGRRVAPTVELGIMIELPSAVALADQLAREVDFFSIGTNDLCQYTLAIDRNDPEASGKHNSFHPALLRLVRETVAAGHRAGIPVGLCGELAGMPEAAPLLVGLELDVLSMNPVSIPAIKKSISALNYDYARKSVRDLLDLDSAQAVYAALTTGE